MIKIALLGAGGKMGCRLTDHLMKLPQYQLRCVETGERGTANLEARGLRPTPQDEAISDAEIVILALPDRILGKAAHAIVPKMKSGGMLVLLDPAAAYAGELPVRVDISYFITHPCHPSVFDHFETELERNDFFGGTHARHAIVCALMQGPEEDYAKGERVARDFYAPVTRAHRVTVAQMAILEPTMAETCGIALIMTLREVMEEAIRRGVPRQAAEDFMFGHIKVPLGIAFNRVDFPFSDGAKLIGEYGRQCLIKSNWKKLFEPESVKEQVRAIVDGAMPKELPES